MQRRGAGSCGEIGGTASRSGDGSIGSAGSLSDVSYGNCDDMAW